MNLENKIEAILFMKGEPQSIKSIASLLKVTEAEVAESVMVLAESLRSLGRGIRLLRKDDSVMLVTAPEAGDVIREMAKEEYDSNLSPATVETLAIIAYKGPIIKAEIDYIRGVNSGFILRNLLIRGLIERVTNPSDRRAFLYRPSFELLQFLGVDNIGDLPEYKEFNKKMEESVVGMHKVEKKMGETFKEIEEDLASVVREDKVEAGHAGDGLEEKYSEVKEDNTNTDLNINETNL